MHRDLRELKGPSWRHVQLYDNLTVECAYESKCSLISAGKKIRFVSFRGQQQFRFQHSSCVSIHQALAFLGYAGASPLKPEIAFAFDMISEMRELVLDCTVNVHNYCQHLRRRSFTNGRNNTDSDVYKQMRIFYPQFSAQMNAMETFSEDPHNISRTYCPACKFSIHETAAFTVDGNFSCKAKESQCRNPSLSHWKNGIRFLSCHIHYD